MGPSYYLLGYHFVFFLNLKRLDEMIPQALCGDVMFYNLSTSRDGLILSPMSHSSSLVSATLHLTVTCQPHPFPSLCWLSIRAGSCSFSKVGTGQEGT